MIIAVLMYSYSINSIDRNSLIVTFRQEFSTFFMNDQLLNNSIVDLEVRNDTLDNYDEIFVKFHEDSSIRTEINEKHNYICTTHSRLMVWHELFLSQLQIQQGVANSSLV